MQDADFLGGLLGQQLSPVVDHMFRGAAGLDRTKPLGVLVTQYGLPPTVVACVPVTDFNALLTGLQPLGVTAQDAGPGMKQIGAMGQMLFAKEANGWALASLAPQMLEGLPEDPSAEFAALTQEYDLALRVNVQNIPAEVRQQWSDFLAASARMSLQKGPEETDEAFALRRTDVESRIEQQQRLFTEFDQLTLGLAVDRAGQRAYFDVVYTAVAGSKLAEELGVYKNSKTNFAGLAQEGAAATLAMAADTSTMDKAQIDQVVASVREHAEQAIAQEGGLKSDQSRETLRAAVGDFIDALRATLESGALDAGAVLNTSPDAVSFVAAAAVGDTGKVEDGIKKLAELGKSEGMNMPEVKWDAESYQDIKFHVFTHPPKASAPASVKAMLGENVEVAVGIGEKAVYVALGKNWLDAVKKVVDDSAANPGKATLPLQLVVSASPIVETVAAAAKMDGEEQTAAMAEMVSNSLAQSQGRDHARLTAEPIENGVRTRFEIENGALQAAATGAMAAQAQAGQAH